MYQQHAQRTVAPGAVGRAVPRRAGVVGPAGELAVELDGRARTEEAGERREGREHEARQGRGLGGSHGRRAHDKRSAVERGAVEWSALPACGGGVRSRACPWRLLIGCGWVGGGYTAEIDRPATKFTPLIVGLRCSTARGFTGSNPSVRKSRCKSPFWDSSISTMVRGDSLLLCWWKWTSLIVSRS